MIATEHVEPSTENETTSESMTHHTVECDWCGKVVHDEAAYPRVQRAADGLETVYLCATCEFGGD
jgi:hypothetical protein